MAVDGDADPLPPEWLPHVGQHSQGSSRGLLFVESHYYQARVPIQLAKCSEGVSVSHSVL